MSKTHLPAIRRHSLIKPAPAVPVIKQKQINSEEAIEFLNDFMKEARKEIRTREKLTLKGRIDNADCTAMSFICETFSLTIDFKGGITL
jgi:hypothetical protein